MRRSPHARCTDRLLAAASRATDHSAGWIALGAVGARIDRDRRSAWWGATFAVAAAEQASVLMKRGTRRARPSFPGLPPLASTPSPLSFPSSHTASAVTAAMCFGQLMPAGPLWAAAIVTALSRPYLGVHYPSDVVAGAVLGRLVGQLGQELVTTALGGASGGLRAGTPRARRPA